MDKFKKAGLYLVSSTEFSFKPSLDVISDFLEAGGTLFQLREKDWTKDKFVEAGKRISSLSERFDLLFILNDDPALALEINADGVHLGQNDMSVSSAREILGDDRIIGVSTHDLDEAMKAVSDGADYINIGPVYLTNTKKGIQNISMDDVEMITSKINIPFTFMGGIKASNIGPLLKFNPSALAMITELTMSDDIRATVKDILKVIGK